MGTHQVIIAGAGPAGASCAKALIEQGVDVLIIERETLPRHKICSGILFGQTQVLLKKYFGGLPPEEVYCEPRIIQASHILEWNRQKGYVPYVWEIDKDGESFPTDYYNIQRNKFDHWLVKQCGAPVRQNCAVKQVAAGEESVTIAVVNRGATGASTGQGAAVPEKLSCQYLIAADGGNSQVRRLVDPDWAAAEQRVVVFQAHYAVKNMGKLPDDQWTVFFEPSIGELLSCMHRKGDAVTLCVGGFKGRVLTRSMEAFKAFLAAQFGVVLGEEQRCEGCLLRMAPPNLGSGRLLLTGEAAGCMYLNGEGISAAIDSGYRAGMAVARAIRENGDAPALYRQGTADMLKHMDICLKQIHFLTVGP